MSPSTETGKRRYWTGKTFAKRHNQALSGNDATKAAKQANAMVTAGVPIGEAIATASKEAKRRKARDRYKRAT